MNQEFTILWLEDTYKVVTAQYKKLQAFLEENGFEGKLIWMKSGEEINDALKEAGIDLILADNNIPELSGADLIARIRDILPLTDILFYSALPIEEQTYDKVGRLGLVRFEGNTKNIVEPAKELIEKNIQLYNDIYFLRGYIVAKSIELELNMNQFLSTYFKVPEDKEIHFNTYMLENKYGNVISKQVCIGKIVEKEKIKKDFLGLANLLQDIFEMRNNVAHCKITEDNILVSMDREISLNREDLKGLLRKMMKASDMINGLIEKFK